MRYFLLTLFVVLSLVLAACASTGGGGSSLGVKPGVTILSDGGSVDDPSYRLDGTAYSDSGIESISYTQNDGPEVPLSLTEHRFQADLTLQDGENVITVTAESGAGAAQSDSVSVSYTAPQGAFDVSPAVAMPGDSVTLSSADFGTGATVSINGVDAAITDAGVSEIIVTVPEAGAWGYPEITVTTNRGSATVGSDERALFVGEEIEGSGISEIQSALDSLPEGGAARLEAGAFTGSDTLVIDNRSLYGADADSSQSVIDGGLDVDMYVRADNLVTVQDLTLISDDIDLYSGRVNSGGLSALSSTPAGSYRFENVELRGETVIEEVLDSGGSVITAAEASGDFDNQAEYSFIEIVDSNFTFYDIELVYSSSIASASVTGSDLWAESSFDFEPDQGSLTVTDSSLTLYADCCSDLNLTPESGDVFITGSEITSGYGLNIEAEDAGVVSIVDSTISSVDETYLYVDYRGEIMVSNSVITSEDQIQVEPCSCGDVSITITDSTLTAEDDIDINYADGGDITVINSTLRSNDGDIDVDAYDARLTITGSTLQTLNTSASSSNGYISLGSEYNITRIENNPLIEAAYYIQIEGDGTTPSGSNTAGTDDVFVVGNTKISAGDYIEIGSYGGDVTVSGNGEISAGDSLDIWTEYGDVVVSNNADLRSGEDFYVYTDNFVTGSSNDVTFTSNTVTVLNNNYFNVYAAYGDMEVTGSDVTGYAHFEFYAGTANVYDNDFALAGSAPSTPLDGAFILEANPGNSSAELTEVNFFGNRLSGNGVHVTTSGGSSSDTLVTIRNNEISNVRSGGTGLAASYGVDADFSGNGVSGNGSGRGIFVCTTSDCRGVATGYSVNVTFDGNQLDGFGYDAVFLDQNDGAGAPVPTSGNLVKVSNSTFSGATGSNILLDAWTTTAGVIEAASGNSFSLDPNDIDTVNGGDSAAFND